jgi:small glutamine-rich tetratricopeptide repeat-containing protein alpha
MSQEKQVAYAFVQYLKSVKGGDADAEKAAELIETIFDVQDNTETFKTNSYFPASLNIIFDAGVHALKLETFENSMASVSGDTKYEAFVDVVSKKGFFDGAEEGSLDYLQRQAKLVAKYKEKAAASQPVQKSAADAEKEAEEKKNLGNAAITAKDYEAAVNYYTEAIDLSFDGPNSHIYYCNRAAAHCHRKNFLEAIDDCNAAITLEPTYVKAYTRLGLSNFFLERYEEAADAYEKAVELEPDNKAHRTSLQQARAKATEGDRKVAGSSSGAARGGADVPDLSNLASMLGGGAGGADPMAGLMNNPMMRQAMDKVGGAEGLASLMKDPAMMQMAQNMMKDPKMMQQAMAMMGGGGGGGMPDMDALAGMMGGGAGSSSGSRGRKG